MKLNYIYTVIVLLGFSGLYSCKKYERPEQYPASVTFQNALYGNTTLITYFRPELPSVFNKLNQIAPGGRLRYVTNDMSQYVNFFDSNDTLTAKQGIFAKPLSLELGAVYTHFLYGEKQDIRELVVKENLPGYSLYDSVTNFRIMNLFRNRSIDVLQTSPATKLLVSDLAYEQNSGFIKLDCKSTAAVFSFEFRDHTTNELLATTSIVNDFGVFVNNLELLYKSNTLTLYGTYTGPADYAAGIGRVPHYF